MVTNILFNAKISKMGDYRIIWIPKSLSEMIKPFEDEKRVLFKIMNTNTKGLWLKVKNLLLTRNNDISTMREYVSR